MYMYRCDLRYSRIIWLLRLASISLSIAFVQIFFQISEEIHTSTDKKAQKMYFRAVATMTREIFGIRVSYEEMVLRFEITRTVREP